MAIDNTPPRLKLIVTIAAITVVTLVSLDFVFKSYYAMMSDEAQREKLAPTKDLDEQHKAEQAALTSAAMPIDKAMGEIAKGARPEIVAPQQSEDLGPMTGWSKLPKPAPTKPPMLAPPADAVDTRAADAGSPAAAADAGAAPTHETHAADAGAVHAPAPHAADAGAH